MSRTTFDQKIKFYQRCLGEELKTRRKKITIYKNEGVSSLSPRSGIGEAWRWGIMKGHKREKQGSCG
jgi:hypothetical protein